MTARPLQITIDTDAAAAYISVSDNPVVRTVRVGPRALVDMDEWDVAVGIELLTLRGPYPITSIVSETHVHSDVQALIAALLTGDLIDRRGPTTPTASSSSLAFA